MHTPIGVKPVAGSKEWREEGEKKGFVYIYKRYKNIFIESKMPEKFFLGFFFFRNLNK